MNAAPEFPDHDTIPPCRLVAPSATGPALAPKSLAEMARALLDAATECAEMVEADYLDNPCDDGCQVRDLRAREARDAAKDLASALLCLHPAILNAKHARGMW